MQICSPTRGPQYTASCCIRDFELEVAGIMLGVKGSFQNVELQVGFTFRWRDADFGGVSV